MLKAASVLIPFDGIYCPGTALFGSTETAFLRLIPSGAGFALQQSPLGELRYSDIKAGLDYASVTALAAGKRGAGNLLAVAGAEAVLSARISAAWMGECGDIAADGLCFDGATFADLCGDAG